VLPRQRRWDQRRDERLGRARERDRPQVPHLITHKTYTDSEPALFGFAKGLKTVPGKGRCSAGSSDGMVTAAEADASWWVVPSPSWSGSAPTAGSTLIARGRRATKRSRHTGRQRGQTRSAIKPTFAPARGELRVSAAPLQLMIRRHMGATGKA
jgi:hypothetical protein